MGYPEVCDICIREKVRAGLFKGDIKLSVRSFKGSNPKVMLVGLNPTLVKGEIQTVFDLDNVGGELYEYIVARILKPCGLLLEEDIYATNLIKCTFPNNQEPRVICKKGFGKNDNKTVKKFLSAFFENCRQYFETEVREIKPKILIAFGEIPHQMLVEEFDLDTDTQKVEKEMRDAFSHIYLVSLFGQKISYAPCIRKRAEGHAELRSRFPTFVENLKKYVISAGIA